MLLIAFDTFDRVIRPPSPLHGKVEHLGREGKDPICLVRSLLHRDVDGLNVSTPDRAHLLRPEFWQDDGIEHPAIIANALGAFLWDRMALQIIDRKMCDGRSFSGNLAGFGGIFAAHRIGEHCARLLFRLVKSEQRAMSTDRQALRFTAAPVAILDDVATNAARLHSDAEPGSVSSHTTMSCPAGTMRSTTVLLSLSAIIH